MHLTDQNFIPDPTNTMPSAVDDDWSDSDDEIGSEVETAVLLGIPDGVVETETDIKDAAVSRIGGHPVRACLFDHVRSTCQCSLLHFFQGNAAFERTTILFISMQDLFVPYGTTSTSLVPSRGQSYG
jgi:hypothetical protein